MHMYRYIVAEQGKRVCPVIWSVYKEAMTADLVG